MRAVLTLLTLLTATPAAAMCAEPIMALEAARPAVEANFADLSRRYGFPWGASHVWGTIRDDRIELAQPYERLSAAHKRQALDLLKLGGLPATLRKPTPFDVLTAAGAVTPYSVFAHDGRVVSLPYDGCTRLYFFTELDRQRMRFMIRTAPPRVPRYPLPEPLRQGVAASFWAAVGKKQPDVLNFAWVPEAGHFEIVVATSARWHYRDRLAPFRPHAPWDLHFVVLDADGEWLEEWGAIPPPRP